MLVRASNGSCATVPATQENIKTLLACPDISEYDECGWFCAVGWDEYNRKVIAVHFSSRKDRMRAFGQIDAETMFAPNKCCKTKFGNWY